MRSCKRGRTLVLIHEGREAQSSLWLRVSLRTVSRRSSSATATKRKNSRSACSSAPLQPVHSPTVPRIIHVLPWHVARPILLRILLQGPLFETRERTHCAGWEFKYFNYFLSTISPRVFVWKVPRIKRLKK